MQQLHLVGFTTDHKGLILGTRRGTEEGSYVVTLDGAFVEQIEELLRRQAGERGGAAAAAAANGTSPLLRRPKVESRLTPREVQALLRTGRSVSEVAEAAGMSEDWVGRFAPPVLAEQARVTERATGLTYSKPRIGPSIQPLGESVVWNLAERGIVLSGAAVDDAWSAFQQPDGGWVVRVSYLAERRRQHADWSIDMTQGVLKAINRLGNELGYVEQGRRRPQALPPATPVSASAQRAAAAPPKLTPPPPLPPRPTGRLSLLGTNAGVSRPSPTAPRAPDRGPGPMGPRVGSTKTPSKDVEEKPEVPAAAPAPPPRERRARPLRPLSASRAIDDASTTPPVATEPKDSGATDSAPPAPRPRRERPLRAPSRIPSDELADPSPAVTRRPVVPASTVAPNTPPSNSAEAGAHRFGPTHSPAERRISTAERFGLNRSGPPSVASPPASVSRRSSIAVAPVPVPSPVPAPEPQPDVEVDDDAGNHNQPFLERRFGVDRPLRARRISSIESTDEESDVEPETALRPASARRRIPGADEVYQAFANLGADDPVTAPVPALDLLEQDDDYYDGSDGLDGMAGDEPQAGRDGLLIRTGQAGSADEGGTRAARKPRPAGDERRPGRLKLRRRPPGSS